MKSDNTNSIASKRVSRFGQWLDVDRSEALRPPRFALMIFTPIITALAAIPGVGIPLRIYSVISAIGMLTVDALNPGDLSPEDVVAMKVLARLLASAELVTMSTHEKNEIMRHRTSN